MNRLLLAGTCALAMTMAGTADAQSVRFSGNLYGATTPFSILYSPESGFIGSDGCIGDYPNCLFLHGGKDIGSYLPTITVDGRRVDPSLDSVVTQLSANFSIVNGVTDGWHNVGSVRSATSTVFGPAVGGGFNASTQSIGHSYNETMNIELGLLEFVPDEYGNLLDYNYNSLDTYKALAYLNFSFGIDFSDSSLDPLNPLAPRHTVEQIGESFIYTLAPETSNFYPLFQLDRYDEIGDQTYHIDGFITRIEIGELGSIGVPILPVETTPETGFTFVAPVVANTPFFFDPPVSVGYDYAVEPGDPLISKAMFPTLLGDLDGFDIYELGIGGSLLFSGIMGGQWVDFTSLPGYASGISGFALRGIDPALEIDPANPLAFVTGLEFASAGTVNLTQKPVTIEWPVPGGGVVPEPASWAMLIAGFGLVGATMRRRRAFA